MMTRVRINEGKVGLVFRNGNYQRVITAGVYWMFPIDQVLIYDLQKPFYPTVAAELLLKDQALADMLTVIDVKDQELVLLFENGVFKSVLNAGRHLFWNGLVNYSFVRADMREMEIDATFDRALLERREVLQFVRIFVVESFERGVLYIDGKFERMLTTGTYYFWKNATSVKVEKVDTRQLQLEVSGQEILTSDKAALRMNFILQYRVTDIAKALIENKDFERQLYVLVQLALREYVGTFSLDEVLEKKEAISDYVVEHMAPQAAALGVVIQNCGVRDIILPGEVREIMNQVLIAQKKAQANVIMRREETASTRSLLNTAKLMEDNEMLFKLKEMEYVEKIAEKIGEITVSGNGQVIDQLRSIFAPAK